MQTELIVFLFIGLIIGALAAWFVAKSVFFKPLPITSEEYNSLLNTKTLLEQRFNDAKSESDSGKIEIFKNQEKITFLNVEVSRLETTNKALNEKFDNQKQEIEDLHKKLKEQFESIAHKIIFDNSRMIQQQHSDKLTDILSPLKEKIEKFENTVNTTHKENIRENQTLKEQLKLLQDLNKSIGDEARNLTSALKGQVKTQGNWGEVILETILEKSGLVKDREYFVQTSMTSDDGRRQQPDVLIKLPEGKTIIIDSKVSLIAYERYSSAETEVDRELAMKEHINSLRRHIKGLGDKKYHQLNELKSLDFVLLFIPIEPAFSAAIQNSPEIFNDAFENNIVLVSTSTLLATLRTIASIWKLEYQNKNAVEIARQGGALYDKFVGLIVDFDKIGDSIDSSHRSWEAAKNKLITGRGNLVTSVQKLKKLGANASKSLPVNYQADAIEEGDDSLIEGETDSEPS
ncbi:MAG: DNA recombination protein RmuC [Bacteroidetes bacterium]|nr:DNA recombination protein RmuC [Bacteroidota bacterium]